MAEAVILGYKLGRILTINNLVVEHKEEANFKDCVGRKADEESKNKPVQNENAAKSLYCPFKNSLHLRMLFLKLILNFHVSCTNQSCSRALPALNLCECRRTSLSGPAWTLSTGGL